MSQRKHTERKRPAMVDWYAPGQLIKTGVSVAMSTTLGSAVDNRRFFALEGRREDCVIDYSDNESLTFDYFADTGDGWDATYTLAHLLTAASIHPVGSDEPLDRAEVVVLGGDAVYPVASKQEYADRLVWPFNDAATAIRKDPAISKIPINDMYIVPGNHDWYDSLGSMSRRFFAYREASEEDSESQDGKASKLGKLKPKRLGQFHTKQVRSYFVIKLPHDWEIWAVDVQLGKDIDNEQFAFFAAHAKKMAPNTKIVFCTAEPTIVYAEDLEEVRKTLAFGLRRVRGLAYENHARVMMQVAGDTHNYQHYEVDKTDKAGAAYQRHHIVSGAGGAFLQPTHSFNKGSRDNPVIEAQARYPSEKDSKRLSWGTLGFAWKHKAMSLFLGIVYTLLFWPEGLQMPNLYVLGHLANSLLALFMIFALTMFAKPGKRLLGLAHGLAHAALAVGIWKVAESLDWTPLPWLADGLQIRLFVIIVGTVLAGTLFGLYLLISLNVFRTHHNEAFSALSNPHYKSFLRCVVEPDGSLTMRVIGIPRSAGVEGKHPMPTVLVETVTFDA